MDIANWVGLIIIIIPSLVAMVLAVVSFYLKLKKNEMTGLSKELSEFIITIVEAAKDKEFTQSEILHIIREGKDVVHEAEMLLTEKKTI